MAVDYLLIPDITMPAGADLSATTAQFKIVKLNSSGQVVLTAATTDIPFGILQDYANSSAVGSSVTVRVAGISKVQADADLTIGNVFGTSADGQAAAYAAGTDTTKYLMGQVISDNAAAAGFVTVSFSCLSPARGA